MVLTFYGQGKGKTTSAVGTMLRSLNIGRNVAFMQLYKNSANHVSHEIQFLQNLDLEHFTLYQFGKSNGWVDFEHPTPEQCRLTETAFKKLHDLISQREADLIVADEFLFGDYYGLAKKVSLCESIDLAHTQKVDLILTGQKARDEIIQKSDLVTEMVKIKHPYDSGVPAQEGLDY